MIRYQDHQPTGFDAKGLNGEYHGISGFWVAPVVQTRDSGCLEQSNFAVMLRELGGESDTVQIHRFGHWGPGWYEIILIDPADTTRVAIAEDCENSLSDYQVLDDEHHSGLEYDAACESWQHMTVRDRVDYLHQYGRNVSVFAARRDELPQNLDELCHLTE